MLKLSLERCSLRSAKLTAARLIKTSFKRVDLRGADLTGADILKAHFENVKVFGIRGTLGPDTIISGSGIDRSEDGDGTDLISLDQLRNLLQTR